jgi:adenylate cyclase
MLQFQITNKNGRQQFEHGSGPIEFGRGPRREAVPRCVIQDDPYVSKDHVRVEELPGNQVRITNLSQRNPIWLADTTTLAPSVAQDLLLPIRLTVGETTIAVDPMTGPDPVNGEALATIAKPIRSSRLAVAKPASLPLGTSPSAETLANWLETVIAVQRAAAGSPEFYEQTAQALVDLVGLDRGLILVRRNEVWEPVARAGTANAVGREFSRTVLQRVMSERRTFFQSAATAPLSGSVQGLEAVVASPVFDSKDQVVGILYGSRTRFNAERGMGIGPLEAQVVQLLASAVGSGLARLEQEAEAGRLRVQFEQFFSTSLAHELERNPRLLEGQEREVTVLFSDIRGFSRLAERLEPQEICRMVREVMNEITEQIRACEGVVVDYSGDGMMAMWNAPTDQPSHAVMACRAALAIQSVVPRLSEAWSERLGGPLTLGLGLNTGKALVGNTGSTAKFKYGPLGHAVNLASRVEGATKQFGIPILISGTTHALLGDRFATRRLCRVRVVGITGAVDLYELHAEEASPEWRSHCANYELALSQYEAGQWSPCIRTIYPTLAGQEGHYDLPSLFLVSRSLECLKNIPKDFEPVIELSSK